MPTLSRNKISYYRTSLAIFVVFLFLGMLTVRAFAEAPSGNTVAPPLPDLVPSQQQQQQGQLPQQAPAQVTQGAPAPQTPPGAPGTSSMLLMFGGMFAIFYFFAIRPQQKRAKEHQDLLGKLKHGDEVVTQSGILGKVTGITDKVATLEVANNVRIKMLKSQISTVIKDPAKDLGKDINL